MPAWSKAVEDAMNGTNDPNLKAAWRTLRDLLAQQEQYNQDFEERIKALEARRQ